LSRIRARKIDVEDAEVNSVNVSDKRRRKKSGSGSAVQDGQLATENSSTSTLEQSQDTHRESANEDSPQFRNVRLDPSTVDEKLVDEGATDIAPKSEEASISTIGTNQPKPVAYEVARDNPWGGKLPPEVVFFGEPRRPPPIEAAADPKYQGIHLPPACALEILIFTFN